ncbi:hypothetical protein ILUMI_15640 [Ignelater luminosus]|uniref:DNA topoisomerase (ATP-hydrolyzing) n=1 Tax=Ignelater luminosus TaxID=2038154 RepID=A0A8K0G9Q4_IGNLU|nr:hypothetical protein ILUMI_15640 [Ignelater luminosus]
MTKASKPKVKDFFGEDHRRVIFSQNLSKFEMEKLDVVASERGAKIFLNGKRLSVNNFKDYIDQYIKNKKDDVSNLLKIINEKANDRWEVALTLSDGGFQQVSFVNSIATTKAARHVEFVTDMTL